jgi:hypothetical protein
MFGLLTGGSSIIPYVLIFIVVMVVLIWWMVRSDSFETYRSEPYRAQIERFELPAKDQPMNRSYLEDMGDKLFPAHVKDHHREYVQKRKAAGDHTLQLWGVNTSMDRYASNHIGPRRPRKIKMDPNSALQPDLVGQADYLDPQNVRLI